ncbi:MAG TPA: hypothetical protein VF169_10080 [Albitalea sp.]|uniref:hypothetical protein n=1 Tax=Piscinibacter sp. TaxID=1903157 RepID=UPI002ED00F90
MPGQLTFTVGGDGPLIDVEVKPSLPYQSVLAANIPHNIPSVTLPFLLDTGSPYCVVDGDFIATWPLRKVNPVAMQTGAQTGQGWWHDLSLRLHTNAGNGWPRGIVKVAALPGHFAKEPHKGIIGRNILFMGSFQFDRGTKVFSIWW